MSVEEIKKDPNAVRLVNAMGRMLYMMQEVDNTCVVLTKDIDKREMILIAFVGDNDGVIMKDIADFMDIPVSTTTGIVDKLVQRDYLQRVFLPEDRRSIKVVLGNKGIEAHKLLTDMRYKMASRIINDLSKQEYKTFISLLEKITAKLNKYIEV